MLIPADYAQVNYRFGGTGLPTGAEVTLGLNVELFAGNANALAAACANAWIASTINAQMSSSVGLVQTLIKEGPNATGAQGISNLGEFGTQPVASVPPNVAVLVRKVTGFGGRTGRGRFYIPGLAEANVDQAGVLSPASLIAWQAALDDFWAKLIAEDVVPSLLHAVDSPVAAPMPIIGFQVDGTVATQRRRLRR